MDAKLIINNQFIDTQNNIEIYSPETEELLGKISAASISDIDSAYNAAYSAFTLWKNTPAHERMFKLELVAKGLLERKEEIGQLLSKEIGKPIKDAINEISRSAEYLLFTSSAFRTIEGRLISGDNMPGYNYNQKTALVKNVPRGVILCISPFNYPINLAITKLAPALVAGNTVLFKPASHGMLSAYIMSQIFCNVMPEGVFNFVPGKSSEIGDYLLTHPKLSMVAFTGSTQTGRHIQKTAIVPLYLELGGKDAAIILDDADLEKASTEVVKGAFSYSAQRCTAIKRVILQENIANTFISHLKEKISSLTLGLAKDNANITALIDKNTLNYVQDLIQDSLEKEATLICGNTMTGNILSPTLLDNVNESMRIYYEEPFGPVLPIIRAIDIEDAINKANNSKYGLQSDVFTQDINKAMYVADKLNAGTVQINAKSDRGPDNFPFPGIKDSGMGVAGLKDSILSMMEQKVIVINT